MISEEITPYLNHEPDVHHYRLSTIQEMGYVKRTPYKSFQEIKAAYNSYHENWKALIGQEDFSRLVKFTNEAGLINTHTSIDLIIESSCLIENEQRLIAAQLENNYRNRLKIGFFRLPPKNKNLVKKCLISKKVNIGANSHLAA